ncbi:MAG TPA: CocE/NonD family hydrolase [Spirochaetota bacterium]|nr:CocE/NonD family hydrolase [Spirochaetota bacterium]
MKKVYAGIGSFVLFCFFVFNISGCQDAAPDQGTNLNVEPVLSDTTRAVSSSDEGILDQSEGETLVSELAERGVSDVTIDLNVRVTVPVSENPHSDEEIDLWGTLIRPAGGGKLPTILVAAPYRREIMMLLSVTTISSGYNLFAVDIRGTGSSEDAWTSFDLVEQYDIRYVVDRFIPSQDWSDGKVGMVGGSYLGIIQLLTAGLVDTDPVTGEPVHLKAIFPQVPMADVYRDIVMHGGNLDLLFIPMWLGIVDLLAVFPPLLILGEDGKLTDESIAECKETLQEHITNIPTTIGWIMDPEHINDGYFYKSKSAMIYWPVKPEGGWGFAEGERSMPSKLPVMTVGGWFDIFTRGTLNTYQYGLSAHDQSDKRMIIGEFYHLEGAMGLGLNSTLSSKLQTKWFDWKIKGTPEPVMEDYPVLLYVMGENMWRGEKTWPLAESRTEKKTLYLTKKNPSAIDGDWYSDEPWWLLNKKYTDNDLGLSETPDYSGDNPVLQHDPLKLKGLKSRASVRWLMGLEALIADISKFFFDENIDASQWYEDERDDEKDCLTFTTEPLEEDVEITGPLCVTFWAKTKFADPLTSATIDLIFNTMKESVDVDQSLMFDMMNKKDVQWVAELNDVFPDGRARNISSGWLSAWHRQYDPSGATNVYYEGPWYNRVKVVEHALDPAYVPFDPFYNGPDKNPVAINGGEFYQYTVELWPTCNVFKKGHRIRISLSASDFPHLLPIVQPSKNTIIIDEDHQAKVDFTTVNRANEGVTWEWIGDSDDADAYLLSGADASCGTAASASEYRGTAAGYFSEILGFLFIMMFPLSIIAVQRYARKRFGRKAA